MRKAWRLLRVLGFSGLAILVLEFGCFWWQDHRAIVIVRNESGNAVRDLKILLNNSPLVIGDLPAGKTKRVRVYPPGEAGVSITYRIGDRPEIKGPGDYIESSGGYVETFTIETSGAKVKGHMAEGFIVLRALRLIHERQHPH